MTPRSFRPVEAISDVAEAGNDVAMLIEVAVDCRDENLHLRVLRVESDQNGVPGGEHRIENRRVAFCTNPQHRALEYPMLTKALYAIASIILFSLATAARAQQIESIGAEKCGGPVQRHEVEFLAPETAQVIVVAKVLRDGKADQTSASILIDGKPCTGSECGFRAEKGRTYGLRAETPAEGFDNICISVGRP